MLFLYTLLANKSYNYTEEVIALRCQVTLDIIVKIRERNSEQFLLVEHYIIKNGIRYYNEKGSFQFLMLWLPYLHLAQIQAEEEMQDKKFNKKFNEKMMKKLRFSKS